MRSKTEVEERRWKMMLGATIKKYRVKNGFTQTQCADYYGCSLRWWQHLEGGTNVSVKTLMNIGRILLVKPWLLLRW